MVGNDCCKPSSSKHRSTAEGVKDIPGLINEARVALTDGRQQGHLSVSGPAGSLLTGGSGKHMVTDPPERRALLKRCIYSSIDAYDTRQHRCMRLDRFSWWSISYPPPCLFCCCFFASENFRTRKINMWWSFNCIAMIWNWHFFLNCLNQQV